jgi:heme exporter protein B
MNFVSTALTILRKDLLIESRSREVVYTSLLFAILWITVAFAGTLALGRVFDRERQNETLRALLLAPASRASIYIGKFLGVLALLLMVEVVVVPLVALMFGAALFRYPWMTIALLAAGSIGYAAVGTLFAAMLVRARSRDVMLPILLYPITVPVMIAGVRGTAAIFQSTPDEPLARFWVALLVFFDVVFVTLALWTFEPVMTE